MKESSDSSSAQATRLDAQRLWRSAAIARLGAIVGCCAVLGILWIIQQLARFGGEHEQPAPLQQVAGVLAPPSCRNWILRCERLHAGSRVSHVTSLLVASTRQHSPGARDPCTRTRKHTPRPSARQTSVT